MWQDNAECSICLDLIHYIDLITTKCKHKFHEQCLQQWLDKDNYNCPLCRTILKEPPVYPENDPGPILYADHDSVMLFYNQDNIQFYRVGIDYLNIDSFLSRMISNLQQNRIQNRFRFRFQPVQAERDLNILNELDSYLIQRATDAINQESRNNQRLAANPQSNSNAVVKPIEDKRSGLRKRLREMQQRKREQQQQNQYDQLNAAKNNPKFNKGNKSFKSGPPIRNNRRY